MNGILGFPEDFFTQFDRLQRQLDQAFPSTSAPTSIRAVGRATFPAIDIGRTPETIEVVAFAPGVDAKTLQITVDKGLLVMAGERAPDLPADKDGISVYARERYAGPFRRVVSLPDDADPGQVDATYRDGLLRVSVGKRESSKPRHIEIK